jgi:hypothetical protein
MANIHVLETDGPEFRVAAHVPISDDVNTAGVNWRTVVINSGRGGKTILPAGDGTGGTISDKELEDIASGAIIEVVEIVKPDSRMGDKQIDPGYLEEVSQEISGRVLKDLHNLRYFGATGG